MKALNRTSTSKEVIPLFKRLAPVLAAIAAAVVVVAVVWVAVSIIGGTTVSPDDSSSHPIVDAMCPEPTDDLVSMNPCYREPATDSSPPAGLYGLELPPSSDWTVDIGPEEELGYIELQYHDSDDCVPGAARCPVIHIYDIGDAAWDDNFIIDENGFLTEAPGCESGESLFDTPTFQQEVPVGNETARYFESAVCSGYDDRNDPRRTWVVQDKGVVIMALPVYACDDNGKCEDRIAPGVDDMLADAVWL